MKAEPQPNHDVNRASGTDSDNGCWLRRLVRLRFCDVSLNWRRRRELNSRCASTHGRLSDDAGIAITPTPPPPRLLSQGKMNKGARRSAHPASLNSIPSCLAVGSGDLLGIGSPDARCGWPQRIKQCIKIWSKRQIIKMRVTAQPNEKS